jgi:lambda family phage portal protein
MLGTVVRKLRELASWTAAGLGFGGYSATDPRRKILSHNRPNSRTANELLTASLPGLRAYCRHLERNNPTARAAIEGLVAQVVATGIALEPDTGDPQTDKRIRTVWNEYIRECSVSGCDLYHLQTQGFREVVASGELLWRLVVIPERAASGKIPIAVLPLEAEWLDHNSQTLGIADANGVSWVGGVGVDVYGRPVAYDLRNPALTQSERAERVSADQIIHEFERRRALQARGEPWMAPVIETLQQERDLVDAELKSAVNTSAMAMVITAERHDPLDTTEDGDDEDPAQSIRLGGVARLYPGEDIKSFSHTRPSQQIRPFREMLCGDIAAALRLSRRWLSKDYSGTSYMNTRAEMLDAERLLAPVREWFGQATAGRLYQAALPYLAIKAGVKTPRPNYRLLPDGQPYVDPYKDIQGAAMGVAAGFTTWEAEIAKRGGDYRAIWEQAARERAEAKKLGLAFDLSGSNTPAPESAPGADSQQKKPATAGQESTDG